jgi:all-trans-retinol 13,14-reductase
MEPEFLIVGSGLAALSFGALMASAGRRVRILEAHEVAGGYGHTFTAGGKYRFNAQLHYVWNCGPGRTVDTFLRKVGLRQQVTFEQYDPAGYDHMRMPGWALDIPGDFDELARRLADLFPASAGRCRAFVDEVRATDAELEGWPGSLWGVPGALVETRGFARLRRWRRATLQDVFDHFALPPEAQALLALQWPDFLLPPDRLSYFAWVKLFAGYARGAYYPTRHFEHVVDKLVERIQQGGGEVLYRRRVDRFLVEGRRVLGVRAEVLGEKDEGTGVFEEHRCGTTVCNMDPRRAAEMIGLERFSRPVRRKLGYEYSPSNFMAYCAVEGLDLEAHGFGRWNLFHAEDADLNGAFDAMVERGDYSRPSFAMTTPGLLTADDSDRPEGRQLVEFLTVADYRRFHELKIGDARTYRAHKQQILETILDIVERDYVPDFRKHLVFQMTGSPTTNERFVRSPMGNSYGSNLTPENVGPLRLDWRSSLEGLYFCNASSGYPGFTGTIWTGCRLYEQLTGDPVGRP